LMREHGICGAKRRGKQRAGTGRSPGRRRPSAPRSRDCEYVPDMDDVGPERVARNEAAFRRVNEAIERGRETRDGLVGFVCECGQLGCNEIIELTLSEYEAVRADARRFAVRHGHEMGAEEVVEAHERFVVVAKKGGAGAVAELHDPR
jgi:hypothetical protein